MNFKLAFLLIPISFLMFTACDDDDPEIPNEEEVITSLTYTLTPTGGGTAVVLSFEDADGDGGNEPVITGGTLQANTTYTGQMELASPDESITEEIMDEDEEHQFFFSTDISGLTVAYSDQDADGNPVGLSTSLTTSDAGSGTLTVILIHEPEKGEPGVSDGDITNAQGETDIQVDFAIDVQ